MTGLAGSLNSEVSAAETTSGNGPCSIVELRRYRLRPGTRERLIDLFDREFVETQEAVGMQIIGQFRDLDDPDAFVWMRGFRDMHPRAEALQAFYGGSVWSAHRDAARSTMVNTENALLLRPAFPESGFLHPRGVRAKPGTQGAQPGLVVATTCYLAPRTEQAFAEFFQNALRPLLEGASAKIVGAFVPERSPNTFSALPVREGETVFVWISSFPSLPAYETHLALLSQTDEWVRNAVPEMDRRTWRRNEVARLTPTARSLLHG